jgi:3-oxoacyl-[acyl-carrier protein] reductase
MLECMKEFASLHGKRVLVTGSSSGIGRSIAIACACAGADLIIHCRSSRNAAIQVAAEVSHLGRKATVIDADVSEESDRKRLLQTALDSGPVDGLVNNAGADLLTTELRHAEFSEKLRVLLQTDVVGTLEMSRLFGKVFLERQAGVILNVGWDQADRGMEGDSGELFAAAKNAVMGFTRSQAVSLAPCVRVNCIAPGWIQTAWGETAGDYWQQRVLSETPLKRWGKPEDIAALARFLLSDDAGFITGQVINVNGGAVR